jgi:hypothetical protein
MDKSSILFPLSPYIFTPVYQIPNSDLIPLVLTRLTCPPDLETNNYWHKGIGKSYLIKRRWAVGAFCRLFLNPRFSYFKPPRKSKGFDPKALGVEDVAEVEAKLWLCIWKTLERLNSLQVLNLQPIPLSWLDIVSECNGLASVYARNQGEFWHEPNLSKKGHDSSAKRLFSIVQRENQLLWELSCDDNNQPEIPFDAVMVPYSHHFVQNCYPLAIQSRPFKSEVWNEIVRARMRLTKLAIINANIVRPNGRIESRGRKPNNLRP